MRNRIRIHHDSGSPSSHCLDLTVVAFPGDLYSRRRTSPSTIPRSLPPPPPKPLLQSSLETREMVASNPAMGSSGSCPANAQDRLSLLTDDLLHKIMSFLTARQAVQTCVLSWRWRNLWCSMPCLDIDQREFDVAASGARGDRAAWECGRFQEFVNNLLRLHSASSLDRFRCRITHAYEFKVVEGWIRQGIKLNPAVTVIKISWSSHTFAFLSGLPHSGFSTACRLKRLHLDGVALDTRFAQQLRSGCPVLEDLKLDKCLLDSPEIWSHTLKSLIVTDCMSYFDTVLTITAPAVSSFHLAITTSRSNWKGITVNEMPALGKASVCSESPVASCKLLCGLLNVQMLELSGSKILSILHMESDAFPTFHNLITLLFDECNLHDDFKILECFLNNTPSLAKLTLHYCKLPGHSGKRKRTEHPTEAPSQCVDRLTFQCAKLKWTEIRNKLSGIWSNLQKSSITITKASCMILA